MSTSPTQQQVDATFYAQVNPEWSSYGNRDRLEHVRGASVVGLTQKPPAKPKPGSIVVKLTLRLPKAVFLALQPEAVIEIPESLVHGVPVEVTAEDPNIPALSPVIEEN